MTADDVRREVRAWLEAHWNPELSLAEWRRKLAEAYLENGDLPAAEALLLESRAHAREKGPPDLLSSVEMQLARLRSRHRPTRRAWWPGRPPVPPACGGAGVRIRTLFS